MDIKRTFRRLERPGTTEHAIAQIASTVLPVLVIAFLNPALGASAVIVIGFFRGANGG